MDKTDKTDNLYEILGVTGRATAAALKDAYYRAAKRCHPDAGGDPAEFVRVSQAYTVLSNPELREYYDLTGEVEQKTVAQIHKAMMETMAQMLDMALEHTKGRMTEVDLIAAMTRQLEEGLGKFSGLVDGATMKLGDLRDIRGRVKRNDDEPNVFIEIIDAKIAEIMDELKTQKTNYQVTDRVLQELKHYSSPVSMFRTMQGMVFSATSRFYPSTTATGVTTSL